MRKSKKRLTSRQLRGCESCRGMDGIEGRGLATCVTRGVALQADMYRFEMGPRTICEDQGGGWRRRKRRRFLGTAGEMRILREAEVKLHCGDNSEFTAYQFVCKLPPPAPHLFNVNLRDNGHDFESVCKTRGDGIRGGGGGGGEW
jgi:hypothetical protein